MDPTLAAAHKALNEGRKLDAVNLLKSFIHAHTAPAKVHTVLLNLLLELRLHEDGVTWAERSVRALPKDYSLHNLHGAFLRLTNRHQEALRVFDRAIKMRPGEIAARANKGHIYNDLKDGKAAEAVFAGLVRQQPRIGELQRALGVALLSQGKLGEAERRFRSALTLNPRDIDAWLDLSATIVDRSNRSAVDRSKRSAALAVLDAGLSKVPGDVRLLKAKAVLLRHDGRERDGAALLRELFPKHASEAWLHHELARCIANEHPKMAGICHRRSIELSPNNTDYRLFFAEHVLRNLGKSDSLPFDEGYKLLTACPLPAADNAIATKIWTQVLTRCADFDGAERIGNFRDLGRLWVADNIHGALLDQFARVTGPEDREELIQQHLSWGGEALSRAERDPITRPAARQSSSKIRLGFMSSDLRQHVVSYFALPLFEHADRDRFEIYCYSFYRGNEDPLQHQLANMVDGFRWNPSISDHDAAQMIADDDLDILFELGGSTHMNKLEVMAWKPAPTCVSWLGYPHSSGLTTIDHLLVDPFLNPPDPALLIETPMIMPHSWIAMSEYAFPDHHEVKAQAPIHRNGFVTFGTANSSYKYNKAMVRAWAGIMARVPGSRFLFVRPESSSQIFRHNILALFNVEGISSDRIEFRAIFGSHMSHYNDIDIALDTFPQTGGTTTCEALWMGVPTVSLVGEALFERLSYSILANAGLSDLCASTVDGYIDIAVSLAADADRLQSLRTGLRDQIRSSPLGQTREFARDFYDLVAATVAKARVTA